MKCNMGGGRTTPTLVWSITTLLAVSISSVFGGSALGGSGGGGCEFPSDWAGRWFQSGEPHLIQINSTHIRTKGRCVERDQDKFLTYENTGTEDCYRCVVINQKHPGVLQFKETFCVAKDSLVEVCYAITGDAPLYTMLRSDPPTEPVPCPFKGAPFTFTYNRGTGECNNPPSRAESCTDDSRLVLKYQACPDVRSTESNVEQLVCLAVWKEGSTRYMVGRVLLQGRRSALVSDEDQYRCFVYEHQGGGHRGGAVTYNIAQSGDATCSGVENAREGSRTIKLTTVDDHHNRCRFPLWLTEHHTWHSLDHRLSYRFSQRNATLKVKSDEGGSAHHSSYSGSPLPFGAASPYSGNDDLKSGSPFHSAHTASNSHRGGGGGGGGGLANGFHAAHLAEGGEVRLVCHSILRAQEKKNVQIVAHVTAGCKSGHVCMVFHKRDSNVIEVQQSLTIEENPDDACGNFDNVNTPYTTLITTSLHPKKCPHLGRYTVVNPTASVERRKRRQNLGVDGLQSSRQECLSPTYESLSVGCSGSHETMEQKSSCAQSQVQTTSAYSCHGSWEENGTSYLIASPIARKSTDPYRYCFIYNFLNSPSDLASQSNVAGTSNPNNGISNGNGGKSNSNLSGAQRGGLLRLTAVPDNCHRLVNHGINHASWTMNLTTNGTCADSGDNANMATRLLPTVVFLLSLVLTIAVIR